MASQYVFPAAVAARIFLCFTSLPEYLKYDQQLSTPLTSHLRLQEGIFLYKHDVDPYAGGTLRHSPLFLSLFTTLLPTSRLPCSVLWTLCDFAAAYSLVRIWRARQRVSSSSRDSLIASLYLLNPYLALPSLALSTATFDNLSVLLALTFASEGRTSLALLATAIATQLSISSALIILPVTLLLLTDPVSHLAAPRIFPAKLSRAVPLAAEYLAYSAALMLACTTLVGSWRWIPETWGASFTLPDLTPNPGLWWYFFTEMFDHFRPFFLMVFSIHLVIYIMPVCIKFQHDPLYAAFILLGVLGTFKAYLSLADPGLFLSMFAIFPEVHPYLRHPIVTALLHLHAALLLPLFHHLWLSEGTGNANFYYASTLVLGLANGAGLLDAVWAGLRTAIGDVGPKYEVVQE